MISETEKFFLIIMLVIPAFGYLFELLKDDGYYQRPVIQKFVCLVMIILYIASIIVVWGK